MKKRRHKIKSMRFMLKIHRKLTNSRSTDSTSRISRIQFSNTKIWYIPIRQNQENI
jgi:hypothetical protein